MVFIYFERFNTRGARQKVEANGAHGNEGRKDEINSPKMCILPMKILLNISKKRRN